jgi:hypothetical protein
MPSKQDPDVPADFMPTKEEILAKPLPPAPPLTPTQQGLSYLNTISKILPSALSAGGLASGIANLIRGATNPASLLASLGTLPVDIHKATGLLGRTAAEPRGMYNLGIRAPGERPIVRSVPGAIGRAASTEPQGTPTGSFDAGASDDQTVDSINLADKIRAEQIANQLTNKDLVNLGLGDPEADRDQFAD